MENASKALIIAGAILLAISIIGLGIFIFRQASNTVSDTGMDQLAVQQFNAQFESFLDRDLSATSAKSLIDTVKTNNIGKTERETGFVKLSGNAANKSSIVAGSEYNAEPRLTNGFITEIIITLKTPPTTPPAEE